MRPSNSSRRPKTQRNVSTRRSSSRTSSTRRGQSDRRGGRSKDEEDRRGGGRKPKKQDNTKLIIGISVGGFFLLILIIAAAASGGKSNRGSTTNNSSTGTSSKQKAFLLPLDIRKKIFREYIAQETMIENEALAKMSNMTGNDRRKEGAKITSEKNSKLSTLRVELSEKYRKKYPKASGTFIRKIINEGIDKNWR